MGRSKFPGKPTKHSNRTRINVLTGSINVLGQSNLLNVDQSKKNGVIYLSENDLSNAEGTPNSTEHTAGSIYPSPQISPRKKRATIHNKRSIFNKNGAKLDSTSPHITCNKRSIRVFSKSRKATNVKTSVTKFENNSVGGKFVLPSRSIHSSRVIKPNKRFMNVAESPDSRSSFKKRPVVSKRHSIKSSQQLSKIQVRKVVTTSVDHGDKSFKEAATESKKSCSTVGSVVLRQARFQVNRSSSGSSSTCGAVRSSDGPFTTMSAPPISAVFSNASGLCSVCGVLRSSTAVLLRKRNKTTRRLNMCVTCDSCRVFLANVIQRRDVLSCVCSHEQTVLEEPSMPLPTQCSACWLNACLRTFQLPLFFKNTLIKLLPRNMQIQSGDVIFGSSPPPLLSWQSHHRITDDSFTAAAVPNEPATATTANYPPQPVTSTIYKRQKVDLKGPRVKHVCRSASIVLGQMAATFDTASVIASARTQTPVSTVVVVNTPNATVQQVPEDASINMVAAAATTTTTIASVTSTASSLQQSKRLDHKQSKLNSTVSTLLGLQYFAPSRSSSRYGHNQEKPEKSCNAIAVDFWESYDVEEVCRNGFGLTGTVPFSLKAICFLCGSGGCEILLHCCICCEPYHPYCLEQTPPIFRELSDRFNWLCPRCTTCSACGLADRQKINCQKCHKTYHPQCFNTKWRTDDRPTVCSNCLRCKSCGTDNITKFVGNLALCLLCFKLRNKGNFCPLCQRCYDDNDFDTKMMECSKCKKWVHSKCEGLSDEQYQILSILPESVEFHCCLCSSSSTPYWRKAIQAELKNSFNTILRLLNKNQIARPLLKLTLTPVKNGADENTEVVEDGCSELATFSRKLHFDVSDGQLFSGAVVRRACIEAAVDQQQQPPTVSPAAPLSPNITDIRRRITRNEYFSLRDFNTAMHQTVLHTSNSTQLLHIYHMVLKKVFPWFDPAASHEDTAEEEDLHSATALVGCDVDEPRVRLDYVVPVALGSPSCIPDTRMCALCKSVGDGPPQKQARLLYCGHNEWIHANCALWSSEVYEEIDGSLQNVHSAINRGKSIKCTRCKLRGASVGCCLKGCYESYHFVCAQMARCHFLTDRSIYCQNHVPRPSELIGSSDFDFDIRRSVYVELDAKKRKLADSFKVNYIVGSLTVLSLGKLCANVSDNMLDVLIPTGFVCSRLFWSTKSPSQLVPYIIKTSVLKPARSNTYVQVDHNFTIDHTLPTYVVNKKLNELSAWLKSDDDAQADVNSNNIRIASSTTAATISDNTAGAVMVTTGTTVDEEEPQNGGDILSPELTDAILQELPHGLLDGLMSMDFNKNSADMSCGGAANDLNGNVSVLSGIGGVGPVRKRRMPLASSLPLPPRDNLYLQHLLVDGPCDDTSSSECSEEDDEDNDDATAETTTAADIDQPVTCDKCKCTYRTSASYKRHLDSCCDAIFTSESDEEDVLVAWRPPVVTTSLGHSAVIDVVASQQQQAPPPLSLVQPSLVQSFPEPTTTYTSYETFTTNTFQQRNDTTVVPSTNHLQLQHQQAFVSCESATTRVADVAFDDNLAASTTILNSYQQQHQSQPKTFFTNELTTTPHHSMVPLNGTDTHYCTLNQTIPINQVHLSLNNNHPSLNVQTNGYTDEVIMPQQQQHAYTIDTSKLLNSHLMNVNMNMNMTENHQWLKSSIVSPSLKTAILNSINNDSRATHQQQHIILARKPKLSNNTPTATVILSTGQNTIPSTLLHSSPCQSVYLQQPQQNQQQQPQHTGNIMSIGPAFVNANGNIQYHLSSLPPPQPPPVSSHMNTINSQPQIIQIATSGAHSHSQVAATATSSTNMLSIMPNVQSQANTCHDGLNVYATSDNSITSQSAGHFIIDANGCMLWTPAATTSTTTALQQHRPQSTTIELQQSQPQQTPPPPLYYGFETIVQNTVMQSQHQQHQHILPTTSLLSTNSSYSTTTQVFQTNKLEPTMLEVSHGGFVLVNATNSGGNGSSNNNTTYPSHRIVAAAATGMPPVAGAAYSTVHPATPLRQDQHKSLVHATSLSSASAGAAAALTKLQSIVIAAAPVLPAQHKSINNRYVRATPVLTPQLPTPQPSDSHRQQRPLPQLPPPLNALKAAPLLVKSQPKKVAPPVPVQVQVRVVQKQVTPKVPSTNSSLVSTASSQPPLSLPPPLALPADTTNVKVISCAQSLLKPAAAVVNVYASPKSVTKYRPVSRVLPMPTTSNVPKQQPSHHKSVTATRLPTTVQQKQMPPPPQLPLAPEKIPHTEMKTKKSADDLVIVQSNKHRFDLPPPLEIKKVPPPPLAMRMEEVPPLQLPLSPNKAATATVPDTEVDHKHRETDFVMRIERNSIVAATAVKDSERNHNNAGGKPDASTTTASVNNLNSDTEEILYTVETHDGFKHSSTSLYELWAKVFEAVQTARKLHNMSPLPENALQMIGNLQLLGLRTNGLRYLVEQLPGRKKCAKYKPMFNVQVVGRGGTDDQTSNPSPFHTLSREFQSHREGCVRLVPLGHNRKPYDMFGWLASKHRMPDFVEDVDPLPRKAFALHTVSMGMRYRQLKETCKVAVGVYPSAIHGRGLFAKTAIESGDMVIEYAGEVIRSVLTDKREKYYNSKGIGCYMFRIDEDLVVDSTMKGNSARFINHSCDPNCYSKVVEFHGHKHIIIFALRRIPCGEELTYDYKFPIEDDKILCSCGTKRCRKFLN